MRVRVDAIHLKPSFRISNKINSVQLHVLVERNYNRNFIHLHVVFTLH